MIITKFLKIIKYLIVNLFLYINCKKAIFNSSIYAITISLSEFFRLSFYFFLFEF